MSTFHIIVKGNVQGVGFRATTEHHATKLGLKGTVKNLSDGSVEIYSQGADEVLGRFVQALREIRGLARIDHISVDKCTVQREYTDFKILF